MGSIEKEVVKEFIPFIRIYNDGSVERMGGSYNIPPSPGGDSSTGTLSKDITISQNPQLPARIYLPKDTKPGEKLPVLLYCHGGAFCIESAFSLQETRFLNSLVSQARVVVLSPDYRLAPEYPVPFQFDDCFNALKWVFSDNKQDPWLEEHRDLERVYVGGDSSGATLAYNVALRAGAEGVPILGTLITHPYFWGSEPVGEEPQEGREDLMQCKIWTYFYPDAPGGLDNPLINPVAEGAPSVAGMGGSRLLLSVAELDTVRSRGVLFYEEVKKSGWKGEVEFIDVKGEDHAFHILDFGNEASRNFIARLASYLK